MRFIHSLKQMYYKKLLRIYFKIKPLKGEGSPYWCNTSFETYIGRFLLHQIHTTTQLSKNQPTKKKKIGGLDKSGV